MADVSKEKLRSILAQAEAAAKKIRQQRDHVLALQFLLADDPPGDAAGLQRMRDFVSGAIDKYHHEGLEAGARDLTAILTMAAAEDGARLALNSSFPVLSEEELHDALVAHAQEIPAGSTAFSRVEAALFAVKLAREHHLPRCVQHLAQISGPDPDAAAATATGEPPQAGIGGETGLPAPARPKESGGGSLEQARDYVDRAFILVNLAVQHVDLAAATISGFLDAAAEEDDAKPSDEFVVIT